jgi:hypothetical protein
MALLRIARDSFGERVSGISWGHNGAHKIDPMCAGGWFHPPRAFANPTRARFRRSALR